MLAFDFGSRIPAACYSKEKVTVPCQLLHELPPTHVKISALTHPKKHTYSHLPESTALFTGEKVLKKILKNFRIKRAKG